MAQPVEEVEERTEVTLFTLGFQFYFLQLHVKNTEMQPAESGQLVLDR